MDVLNLYAYCGNNPLKYIDPTGLENRFAQIARQLQEEGTLKYDEGIAEKYNTTRHLEKHQKFHVVTKDEAKVANITNNKIKPRYFGQREFDFLEGTTSGGKRFNFITDDKGINQLCNATSMINEMSEEYTKRKGQILTLTKAADMLRVGLKKGSLNAEGVPKDPVEGKGGFLNDAWSVTGLGGSWERDDSKANHQIYFTKGWFGEPEGNHFLDSGASGNFSDSGLMFDPWDAKEESPPITSRLREIRNYEYKP